MKFKSDTAGYVTGVRFYKNSTSMGGVHTGSLWDAGGNRINTVTFTGETSSGWQLATFATPTPVTANTIYTISVFHTNGRYAATSNYFTSEVAALPLRAPADGLAPDTFGNVGQGVFNSNNTSAYPSASSNKANYWVDVAFFDTSTPQVTVVTPADDSVDVIPGETLTATFDQVMDATSFSTNTFTVADDQANPVAGAVTYNATTKTASFVATEGFATNKVYTATLEGGSGTVVKNGAGVALSADYSWNFTTEDANACPCTLKNNVNPAGSSTVDDTGGLELGVKVRPSTNGYISAVRFYKPLRSTEITHNVTIWSSTGTSLATGTSANETDYGWQEVKLSTPLRVNKDQLYIVSYSSPTAVYQATTGGLNSTLTSGYLQAFADNTAQNAATGSGNRNGVFSLTAGNYPSSGSTNGSYYWIDAVFSTQSTVANPLSVMQTQPINNSFGASNTNAITATVNHALNSGTVSSSTVEVRNAANALVSGTVGYISGDRTITFTPSIALTYGETYTVRLDDSITDTSSQPLGSDYTFSFTVGSELSSNPATGPGGPVLVVTASSNAYSSYYAEIMRTEGLNAFTTQELAGVTASMLANYDAVVLAETSLTQAQADMFNDWVQAGGDLVAMRPDKKLAGLLGLTDASSTRTNQYFTVNTAAAPGTGIVSESMQFKGVADNYTLSGTTAVATLYSDALTTTSNPAVTTRVVGGNGGSASAFAYDLAKSVVALHQGNQSWAGQDRDGSTSIRTNDLFFGARTGDVQPDWVDLTKIGIPQADEQQRLFANLLTEVSKDQKPLPRFWYMPGDYKAALVLAGDDHGLDNNVGTEKVFTNWLNESPTNCLLANWECVRASNYTYTTAGNVSWTNLTPSRATQLVGKGFELGSHVSNNSACNNFTSYSNLGTIFTNDLTAWRAKYTGVPNQISNRFHCYIWSDWDSMTRVHRDNGIRYDLNYVAFPSSWLGTRSPVLTGSGMNMRLTDASGNLVDVYQGVTNFDNQTAGLTSINALLDSAVGSAGYYGYFGTHYDMSDSYDRTMFDAAKAHNIPMVTAKQVVAWKDGRGSSTFSNLQGVTGQTTFTLQAGVGAHNLRAMVPATNSGGTLTGVKRGSSTVSYQTQTIKGVSYAVFEGRPGDYTATYSNYDPTPPVDPDPDPEPTPIPSDPSLPSAGNSSGSANTSNGSSSQGANVSESTTEEDTVLGSSPQNQQNSGSTKPKSPSAQTESAPEDGRNGLVSAGIIGLGVLGLGLLWWIIAAWRKRRHPGGTY